MARKSSNGDGTISKENLVNWTLKEFHEFMGEDAAETVAKNETGLLNSEDAIPSHNLSDYLELVFLLLTFVVGVIANVYVFVKLFRAHSVARKQNKVTLTI